MSSVPTVVAKSAGKIAHSVALCHSADRLLQAVGLDRDALTDPELRVPYADVMLLLEHAARMTKDADFGLHIGEQTPESEYGLIGRAMVASLSLGEALRCLVRYLPIWTNGGVFKLEVEGPIAHFQWEYSPGSLPDARHDCESSMASVMRLNRLTRDERWWPKEVWFRHAKPRDTSEHARIFRAPVRFGMPADALLLDRRVLDLPFKSAQPRSHRKITEAAEQLLPEPGSEVSFSQCVLSFIRQNLGTGSLDLEVAARALGSSRRSFQRKLKQEATSYRDLVQQARRDLAEHLLLDTEITSTEAAYVLGYSEHCVFHRAFQKWHGGAPGEFRKRSQS
jgi:AraC-like DNA-binding protein